MRQSPATKSLQHFIQRMYDRIEEIEAGKLELQVSPLVKVNKKHFWLMFVDIESIVKLSKPSQGISLKTFTGKGLHVFNFVLYEIDNLIEYRNKLRQIDCVASKVDISTTLRATPVRYLGCFSLKYNIWLHPYLIEHNDLDDMKALSKKSPSQYLRTKYAKQVCNYLNIRYDPNSLTTYTKLITLPLQKARWIDKADYITTLLNILMCE